MTAKLSTNQKKYNKMISGLAATWNCDLPCSMCPFYVTSEKGMNIIKCNDGITDHCGAMAIRKIAKDIFMDNASKKNREQLYRL